MRLKVNVNVALPPLAWVAKIRKGAETLEATCGSGVEHGDGFLVEGCWSGDFDARGLLDSQVMTGTGVAVGRDGAQFITASDTTQPLYRIRSLDALHFSNSLPLLLEFAQIGLLPDYPYYDTDLMSVFLGLRAYRPQIPTTAGKLGVDYHCIIGATADLTVEKMARPLAPHFPDFERYLSYLRAQSSTLARNAQDPHRKTRYSPLATVSSGYDSSCCAVFAREAGCSEAITFTRARADFGNADDRGTAVGKHLGLDVRELDPATYRSAERPEIEFIASGYGADDVVFSSARTILQGRLLFTGYHGDRVWSNSPDYASDHIVRGDPSGGSLLEFRLATGFQNLPLPFAGALRHHDLVAISNSAQMAPWRVGGEYDRPIPRRILETAGVPRGLFGQHKKAVSTPYQGTGSSVSPGDFLTSKSNEEFLRFRKAAGGSLRRAMRRHETLATASATRLLESPKVARLLERVGANGFAAFKWRYSKPISETSFLFHWAVHEQRLRYRAALAGVAPA